MMSMMISLDKRTNSELMVDLDISRECAGEIKSRMPNSREELLTIIGPENKKIENLEIEYYKKGPLLMIN